MTPTKALLVVVAVCVAVTFAFLASPQSHEEPTRANPAAAPPTAEAAIEAATRFLVGLDASTLLDATARRKFVERWAAGRSEVRLQRLYRAEARRLAVLERGFSRAALLGYRRDRIGTGSAVISIWAVSLASIGHHRTAIGWRAFTVRLVVEDRRWRIADVREVPGPSIDGPPRQFRRQAGRFEEYRIVP